MVAMMICMQYPPMHEANMRQGLEAHLALPYLTASLVSLFYSVAYTTSLYLHLYLCHDHPSMPSCQLIAAHSLMYVPLSRCHS